MIVGTVVALMLMIMLALFTVTVLMSMLMLMRMGMAPGRPVRVSMRVLVRMIVSAFHKVPPRAESLYP